MGPSGFSDDVLNRLRDAAIRDGGDRGTATHSEFGGVLRQSHIIWLLEEDYPDATSQMRDLLRKANREGGWNYQLGSTEPLQVALYDARESGTYDWHMDESPNGAP